MGKSFNYGNSRVLLEDHHLRQIEGSCSGFKVHQVYFASYVEYSRETPKIMSFVNFQSGTGQKSKK